MSWYCFNCTLVWVWRDARCRVQTWGKTVSSAWGLHISPSFWSHQPQGLCSSPPVEGALIGGGNKISWQLTMSHAIHTLVLCLSLSSLFSSQTVRVAWGRKDRKKTLADLGSWLWCHIAYCELTEHRSATQKPPYFLFSHLFFLSSTFISGENFSVYLEYILVFLNISLFGSRLHLISLSFWFKTKSDNVVILSLSL